MKQTDPQYKLRMPTDLKDQVEAAASTAGRSMNAEIVARLAASFEPATGTADLSPILARLERDLAQQEVKTAAEQIRLWLVAVTLRNLLKKAPKDQALDGPLSGLDRGTWENLLEALVQQTAGAQKAFSALNDKTAEANARLEDQLRTHGRADDWAAVMFPDLTEVQRNILAGFKARAADLPRPPLVLAGSDRPADLAAATGQKDIFEPPAQSAGGRKGVAKK